MDTERFGRRHLSDEEGPTLLGVGRQTGRTGFQTRQAQLLAGLSVSLRELASQFRLTYTQLLAGSWALLLSRYSGQAEVRFGFADAGAAARPVQVTVPDEGGCRDWLQSLPDQLAAATAGSTDFESQVVDQSADAAMCPLTLLVAQDGTLTAVYTLAQFDDAVVERLLDHFQTLLGAMAARPDLPPSRLPMLTEAELLTLAQ